MKMKKLPLLIGLALLVAAVVLSVYAAGAQGSLGELLARMHAAQAAGGGKKMKKGRGRVLDALAEGDRVKTLRSLDRYTEGFADKLDLSGQNASALFFYKNRPSMLALAALLCASAPAFFCSAFGKLSRYRMAAVYLVLAAALFAGVYILENIAGSDSMLLTALKKGAIYALIAIG